ncbi:MAG: hypothetical protein HY074_01395 [Deltaproteobacteria bacterium]|nr:hypothetical protein [Deltaproteobacteria bacterium]
MTKAVRRILVTVSVINALLPAVAWATGKKRPVVPVAPIDISRVTDNAAIGCIDADVAHKLIKDYGLEMGRFSGSTELCDSKRPGKKMLNAILMLDQGKFGPTARAGLDRQMITTDYATYFRQRIGRVVFDNQCGGTSWVLACVINSNPVMHVEKPYFDDDMALALQMTVLVHEARHTEGFPHYRCYTGGNAGKNGACDLSYEAGGAYAVEVEYETRVALNGLNFNPVFKTMARLFAIDRLNNNFVTAPTTKKPALFLVDQADSHVVVLDREGHANELSDVVLGKGRLIGRDSGANLMFEDPTREPMYLDYYARKLFPQTAVAPVVGLTMRNYATSWSAAKKQNLVDILNDAAGNGIQIRLFKNQLEAAKGLDNAPVVDLPATETPVALLSTLPCLTPEGASVGFYVRMASGAIYQIDTSNVPRRAGMSRVACTWPQDLASITRFSGKVVVLDGEGHLSVLEENGTRSPFPGAPGLAARRFTHAVAAELVPELVSDLVL